MVPVAWSAVPDLTRRFSNRSTDDAARATRFDVVGIGNALVDVIAPADEDFLRDFDLVKGSMTLIETERAVEGYGIMMGFEELLEMTGSALFAYALLAAVWQWSCTRSM